MGVNFPAVNTFPLVPLMFALIWVANSCSFGSPASPISSLGDSPIAQTSVDIEILNEISKCLANGIVEDIMSNITGSILREAFAMQEDSLEDLRQQFLGQDRLPPIVSATEVSGTRLKFENTRHRYSWTCSLRRRDAGRRHLCSVTLLARPPRQTVIVGAAHCTFLCQTSAGTVVPDCCCGGQLDCSADRSKCPGKASVVQMTGEHAEILCGEWQTGDLSPEDSQEEFNILLPILEILRHPDYTLGSSGQAYLANDVAVFKVDDRELSTATAQERVYPACLPLETPGAEEGVHAGWTNPPPLEYVQEVAPGYERLYPEFLKQWHYKMKLTACQDVYNDIFPSLSTTRTFYPPGTVCARDKTNSSCFYSGNSGSPLMLREQARPERFYVEGLLSYINGCDYFYLGPELGAELTESVTENFTLPSPNWVLSQKSQNPAVYSRLICFLPWIAQQYDLTFDERVVPASCRSAVLEQEERQEGAEGRCLTVPEVPFQLTLSYQGAELLQLINSTNFVTVNQLFVDSFFTPLPCIFPFYLDNKLYHSCIFIEENQFRIPVFFCPVRNITTKIGGVNSFSSASVRRLLYTGYCEEEERSEGDLLPPLTPACSSCPLPRVAFSACTNNCPGGQSGGPHLSLILLTFSKLPRGVWRDSTLIRRRDRVHHHLLLPPGAGHAGPGPGRPGGQHGHLLRTVLLHLSVWSVLSDPLQRQGTRLPGILLNILESALTTYDLDHHRLGLSIQLILSFISQTSDRYS